MINKVFRRLAWVLESATWPLQAPFRRYLHSRSVPMGVTIGITTYKDRFEECLKPLLPKLYALFPNEQVIVMANGHYQKEEQIRYIDRFNDFCCRYRGVLTETYVDPQGLSHLWNRIIARAQYPKILILNDDIMIKTGFRRLVMQLMTRNELLITVNGSWSHFLITKKACEIVGSFDEGFMEIGGEDDDYLARMAFAGVIHGNVSTSGISGRSKSRMSSARLNSYGRDMSAQVGGYSTLNSEYLMSKWETSDTYFEGAVEVRGRKARYWKPRAAEGNRDT